MKLERPSDGLSLERTIPFFDCWTRTAFRVLTTVTLIPPIRTHSYYQEAIYTVNDIIYSINGVISSLNAIICSLNVAIYSLDGGIYSSNGAPYSGVLTPVALIPPLPTYSSYYEAIYSLNTVIYPVNYVIYPLNAIICLLNAAVYSANGAPYSRVLNPVPLIPPIPTYSYRAIFSRNGAPFGLRYQANGSAYVQQKLGDRWLVEARTLVLDNEALTNPHDLEVVEEVLLSYVLHS